MVWPHPRDVILYARSSYFYDNMFIICLFLTLILSDFKTCFWSLSRKIRERLPYVTLLDVTSTSFLSLVPCLQFTLRNVAAKAGN